MKKSIEQLAKTTDIYNSYKHHDEAIALLKLISFSIEDIKENRVVSNIKIKEKLSDRKSRYDK